MKTQSGYAVVNQKSGEIIRGPAGGYLSIFTEQPYAELAIKRSIYPEFLKIVPVTISIPVREVMPDKKKEA